MAGRELSPKLLEIAKKELNEDPKRREADVQAIKDWLKKQPHIVAKPDDQTILTFLRGCKFSLERTKEKLDMYYTMRTIVPEFFGSRSLKEEAIRDILYKGAYLPLPQPDENGCRIVLSRAALVNVEKYSMEFFFKLVFMAMDYLIREDDQLLVCGVVAIIDLENVSLAHGMQMTPVLIKKVMTCAQEGFPLREKGVNFVHTPPMFETIFNFFKSFSKDKLKKRLHVHGDDMDSLHRIVPQKLLPAEYGGTAGTTEEIKEDFIKRLEAREAWFLEQTGGVDEKKRPGKPKTHQQLFGLEGSFRQLNVD